MKDFLIFDYNEDKIVIRPTHKFVKHWNFNSKEKFEAYLAHFVGEIAEKNGLTKNDVMHIFPLVLRMLKSKSLWAE